MNIRERLEALVVNPRLVESGGDLDFAKSLLGSYNERSSLSSGRRVWLDKLEEKYSEENFVDPLDNETGLQLKSLLSEDLSNRDRAFVESLKGRHNLRCRQIYVNLESPLVLRYNVIERYDKGCIK